MAGGREGKLIDCRWQDSDGRLNYQGLLYRPTNGRIEGNIIISTAWDGVGKCDGCFFFPDGKIFEYRGQGNTFHGKKNHS